MGRIQRVAEDQLLFFLLPSNELVDYGIETLEQFEDSYQGQHDSGADFAESTCEDCGYLEDSNLPMFIQSHFDWATVWSNELRFDYFEVDGHFFRNF